jgi:hypothetical protein
MRHRSESMVDWGQATVRQEGRQKQYNGHGGKEERYGSFLGPLVGHWDFARKLQFGGRGRKKLTGSGYCPEDRRRTYSCGTGGFLQPLRG